MKTWCFQLPTDWKLKGHKIKEKVFVDKKKIESRRPKARCLDASMKHSVRFLACDVSGCLLDNALWTFAETLQNSYFSLHTEFKITLSFFRKIHTKNSRYQNRVNTFSKTTNWFLMELENKLIVLSVWKVFGFTLSTLRDWLKKFAPLLHLGI